MCATVSFSCGRHCRLKRREFILCFEGFVVIQKPRTGKAYLGHSFFNLIIKSLKDSFWTQRVPWKVFALEGAIKLFHPNPSPLSYEMTPPPGHMFKVFVEVLEEGRLLVKGKKKGVSRPGPCGHWSFFISFKNSSEFILGTFEKPNTWKSLNSLAPLFLFPSYVSFVFSFYTRSNWYCIEIPVVWNLRKVTEYK